MRNYIKDADKQNILHKEIDLIQSVIIRMAQNSFYMKGWCITLIAAIFSLSESSARAHVYLPLAIMSLIFWALDSYYLRQERLYRKLYELVLRRRVDHDKWEGLYSLKVMKVQKLVGCVPRLMVSTSEWPLYLTLFVFLLIFGRSDVSLLVERVKESSIVKRIACENRFGGEKTRIVQQPVNALTLELKGGEKFDGTCRISAVPEVQPPEIKAAPAWSTKEMR